MRARWLAAVLFAAANALHAAPAVPVEEHWRSAGGTTTWWLNDGVLRPLGVRVAAVEAATRDARDGDYRELRFAVAPHSGLGFRLQARRFTALDVTSAVHRGGPVLKFGAATLDLRGFRLVPRGRGTFGLDVADAQGRVWLRLDHAHNYVDAARSTFAVRHMDLRLGAAFAHELGRPELAGLLVGGMQIETAGARRVSAAQASGQAQCPLVWPNDDLHPDLRMLNLATNWEEREPDGVNFYRCGRADGSGGHTLPCTQDSTDGVVVLSPDASMRNEGAAAAAWYPKFSAPSAPYGNDQHPVLVWNLYRVDADGSLHPIGVSGAKHAFHSINAACACGEGEALFPGCEDTYGGFSNDYGGGLGPRAEIIPAQALWARCGSVFDRDCDGQPDADVGRLDDDAYNPLKRFNVREAELSSTLHPGARWFVEYWYVVRDAANPYGALGLLETIPTKAPGQGADPNAWIWRFSRGAFYTVPMVTLWKTLAPAGAYTHTGELAAAEGHVRVVARATPRPDGLWRYDYAVFNLDYARTTTSGRPPDLRMLAHSGLTALSLPLAAGLVASASGYGDADGDPANDWGFEYRDNRARWSAPGGPGLEWGRTATFTLVANLPPVTGSLGLEDRAAHERPLAVATLVPGVVGATDPRR